MRRDAATNRTAGILRARHKLHEYSAWRPIDLPLPSDFTPSKLFPLAVGFLGDLASERVAEFANVQAQTQTSLVNVAFSAKTFLAYANSRVDDEFRDELVLLSAAAFHLVDMPGVSRVQANLVSRKLPSGSFLERALVWALVCPWVSEPPRGGERLEVDRVARTLWRHYKMGVSRGEMRAALLELRRFNYASYDDRDLLLADLFSAVVVSRYENSSRNLLHNYAGTTVDAWTGYLASDSAVHELWPSQRKLGEARVFSGSSAIVQMPTSAGKTKATELILRTAFTAGRAHLAVVVAPFVALCDEIHESLRAALSIDLVHVNRLGDALQADYPADLWGEDDVLELPTPHLVVITPEKLLYVLRQRPDVASRIDLVVYDEGHQFDSGARGVTYELLLTSIKARLRKSAQTILISAVIQNADTLADWLLGLKANVVIDTANQTQRSIGFTSQAGGGQIHFLENSDSEPACAVPGVLVREVLPAKQRERTPRYFPESDDSKSVALYLGVRLVANGGVAIFCGKRDSAPALLRNAIDVFSRGPTMAPPSSHCDEDELRKFADLLEANFGEDCYLTDCARLGIYAHTGSTPKGVRSAIEHAMREGKISFVVCTSTLAQGVNLPIKYLLVAGTHQGRKSIRIRDFKNLMGRAGRAGMHEEGTIIFCDPSVYDEKETKRGKRRWYRTGELIDPASEDPVGSSLLVLVLPFKDKFEDDIYSAELNPLEIALFLIGAEGRVDAVVEHLSDSLEAHGLEEADFRFQLEYRLELLKRLQSHVMASATELADGEQLNVRALALGTLAYHLANESQKVALVALFEGVSTQISLAVPANDVQVRFGRSLLGVLASLRIDAWVEEHLSDLLACADPMSLARTIWPLFQVAIEPSGLRSCSPPEAMESLFISWLEGVSYGELLSGLSEVDATYRRGTKRARYDIDDVVDLCENFFGYEVPLVMAALRSSVVAYGAGATKVGRLSFLVDSLQKQVKYGLPSQNCVAVYEAGFSDRVVAQKIEQKLWGKLNKSYPVAQAVQDWQSEVEDVVLDFPSYFRSVFLGIIAAPIAD